ncbi:MAG: glycerol kinase GlpK [Gemmatimonadaceae bacterium]|nr:glycerol kinase GlpK [Gemmatimonadaceae bacterium]MDQ3517393.1 glycerol kinase GlpK [Gemmatimonadota bacterium]
MKHVLAIDQGTTGSTCLMIARDGSVKGRGYREITQHFPRPGWVEHDALDILSKTLEAAHEAIGQANADPAAIGITNQRETVLLWERSTGTPMGRAIVWQDRRTAERCAELTPSAARIAELTGLVTDPYFSATKLEWMLSDKRIRARAESGELAAGTIDSWLVWQLTGGRVHATDPTNASRTMLYDIQKMQWSDELCALFGVPPQLLPEVRPSAGDFGRTRSDLFGREIPITGIAGDQQAALYGQGCWSAGQGKNTYGTGAFLLMNTGTRRGDAGGGLLATVACDAEGKAAYALEGSIFIAGAAVQWLRDGLGIIGSAQETEAIAQGLDSTGGVYFVPALAGLGAPHWEPEARGTIVGLTRGSSSSHLVRAALEAMAFGTAEVLEVMRERGGASFTDEGAPLRVDGGATSNDWLMQFQADVLGCPVERPQVIETTALGAAGLAGLASGIWPDASSFLATRDYTRWTPGAGVAAALEGRQGWDRAVRATLSWARDSA